MKIYQVGTRDRHNGHEGYEYVTSKAAVAEIRKEAEAAGKTVAVHEHTLELTKVGVLRYLNCHAGHPDNG